MKRAITVVILILLAGCGGKYYFRDQYGPKISAGSYEEAYSMAMNDREGPDVAAEYVSEVIERGKLEDFVKKAPKVADRALAKMDEARKYDHPSWQHSVTHVYPIYKAAIYAAAGRSPAEASTIIKKYVSQSKADIVLEFQYCHLGLIAADTAIRLNLQAEALTAARIAVIGECGQHPYLYDKSIAVARRIGSQEDVAYLTTRKSAVERAKAACPYSSSTYTPEELSANAACEAEKYEAEGLRDLAYVSRKSAQRLALSAQREKEQAAARPERRDDDNAPSLLDAVQAGILASGPNADRSTIITNIARETAANAAQGNDENVLATVTGMTLDTAVDVRQHKKELEAKQRADAERVQRENAERNRRQIEAENRAILENNERAQREGRDRVAAAPQRQQIPPDHVLLRGQITDFSACQGDFVDTIKNARYSAHSLDSTPHDLLFSRGELEQQARRSYDSMVAASRRFPNDGLGAVTAAQSCHISTGFPAINRRLLVREICYLKVGPPPVATLGAELANYFDAQYFPCAAAEYRKRWGQFECAHHNCYALFIQN
jgi:hypothetical protein